MVKYNVVSTTETYNSPILQNRLFKFTIKCNSGEKILKKSIKVSGKLKVYKANNAPIALEDNVFYDSQAGVHSLFAIVNTSVTSKNGKYQGMVENLNQYDFLSKVDNAMKYHYNKQMASNSTNTELVCGSDAITQYVLLGQMKEDLTSDLGNDFMFVPKIFINKTFGDIANLSQIDIQMTTNSLSRPFFTTSVAFPNGFGWSIENLKCHFVTVPCTAEEEKQPLQYLKIIESNRSVLVSSNGLYSFNCPSQCLSTMSLFQDKNNLGKATVNQLILDEVLDVRKVEYTVGGQTCNLKFILQNEQEIRANFIQSNNLALKQTNCLWNSDSFGIGLNFLDTLPKDSNIGLNIVCGDGYGGKQFNMLTVFNCIETI